MGFFVCMKREGDEKGTAEQSEAKNHPVNGFLVPRAGGGTGPVPPDESPYLHTGFHFEFHSLKEETLFIATPQSHFVRQLPGRGAFWAYNLLLSRPWQQLPRSFAKVAQHKHERSGDEQPQCGKAC